MKKLVTDVMAFHTKFGLTHPSTPRLIENDELATQRVAHLLEELDEYIAAVARGDLHGAVDALIDLAYVTVGGLALHGVGPEAADAIWDRVQVANMAKRRATCADESKRGSSFDVVKPEGWEPPTFHDLLGLRP